MIIEVRKGSVYNPGWEVAELVSERHWNVRATFEERPDAEDFAAYLQVVDKEEREP